MEKFERRSHKLGKLIAAIVALVSLSLVFVFLYLYNEYLSQQPLIDYPKYTISTSNWTNDSVIITVTNSKEKISLYSFYGGISFQDNNTYEVSQNGTYKIVVKDINNRSSKIVSLLIRNIDKDAPKITFDSPVNITANSEFSLSNGVIVTDNDGSGLNGNYTIVPSSIDTSKEGTYTVIYKASDRAGNYIEKERTIIVSK